MDEVDCFYCTQPATRRILPTRLKFTREAYEDRNKPDPPPLLVVCDDHEDRGVDEAMEQQDGDGVTSVPLHEPPRSAWDRARAFAYLRWGLVMDAAPVRAYRRWRWRRAGHLG